MAVIMFLASVCLTLGVPAIWSLLAERTRRLGITALALFTFGAIGLSGYAMLLVFVRAMIRNDLVGAGDMDRLFDDAALLWFIGVWFGASVLGLVMVAVALLVARTAPVWVPVLILVSTSGQLVLGRLGDFGTVLQYLGLAVAFTGLAVAAAGEAQRHADELTFYT
jgi:hypothetical protein